MKYISTFSGIEATSVAWEPLGFEPMAFSEIEPFPCAVLQTRFPQVPNLGDITKVDWSGYRGAVDVVVGGSPCQSFSVAGKRKGLAGESGLMFEYIRCVRDVMPRYFVWENVPGCLSVEGGGAFKQLLWEMDDLGYSLAWRVLDAQFFGVAQRRRRVFLVGSLTEGRSAEILFERGGLRWDFKTGKDERARLAADAKRCVGGSVCIQGDIARGAHMGQNGIGCSDDGASYTLNTIDNHAVVYKNTAYTFLDRCGNNWENGKGGCGVLMQEDVASTLATVFPQTVLQPIAMASGSAKAEIYDNLQPCQTARQYKDPSFICADMVVRRLTPTECERLQGFPDGWTDIEYRGKPAADAPRYKALGNSMAVPVMRWIGEKIKEVERCKSLKDK